MKSRTFFAFATLFLVAFISSMTGYVLGSRYAGKKLLPEREILPEVSASVRQQLTDDTSPQKTTENEDTATTYILREENGIIALYSKSREKEKLWQTYDISVKLLPQSDRNKLNEGIVLSEISEALQLVEDYSG